MQRLQIQQKQPSGAHRRPITQPVASVPHLASKVASRLRRPPSASPNASSSSSFQSPSSGNDTICSSWHGALRSIPGASVSSAPCVSTRVIRASAAGSKAGSSSSNPSSSSSKLVPSTQFAHLPNISYFYSPTPSPSSYPKHSNVRQTPASTETATTAALASSSSSSSSSSLSSTTPSSSPHASGAESYPSSFSSASSSSAQSAPAEPQRHFAVPPDMNALESQDELDNLRYELSQRMSEMAEHPIDEVSLRASLIRKANDCEMCGPQPHRPANFPSSSDPSSSAPFPSALDTLLSPPHGSSSSALSLLPPPHLRSPSALVPSTSPASSGHSGGWRDQPHHLNKEELWRKLRSEAKTAARAEPALASFLYSTVLSHSSFERTMSFLLANKLGSPTMLSTQLLQLFRQVYDEDPDITEAARADLHAVRDRDPACETFIQAVLNFKGFQAVQSYRIAHALWNRGRRALALALQSRISEVFHVDIHPAARIGRGILIDHATGVVIGQTAIVGDNVSMLHHVTLGGSGRSRGVRHPCIGNGVLLGAGVSVLGPVSVGAGSKVGAGSVVVHDLPCFCVAVGVPARIVKRNVNSEPVKDMDQCFDFILDYVI